MNWQSVLEATSFVLEVVRDGRFMLAVLCLVGGLVCRGYNRNWEAFALMTLSLVSLFWAERARVAKEASRYVPPSPEFVRRRNALVKMIRARGTPTALSLEEFFEGNTDYGSIGCNLPAPLGPQVFQGVLEKIRSQPEVQDVLVEVRELDEEDESMWPHSDTVYVLTRAPQEVVANWLKPLQPDEVEEGFGEDSTPPSLPELQPGMRVLYAWWD